MNNQQTTLTRTKTYDNSNSFPTIKTTDNQTVDKATELQQSIRLTLFEYHSLSYAKWK